MMKFLASHYDGFTTELLTWELEAENGLAIVEAEWLNTNRRNSSRRHELVEFEFPRTRIEAIAEVLSKLKEKYDGQVDDFPTYSMAIVDGQEVRRVTVTPGFHWKPVEKVDVEAFMSIYLTLSKQVEAALGFQRLSVRNRKH